jgi:hypothetical protein
MSTCHLASQSDVGCRLCQRPIARIQTVPGGLRAAFASALHAMWARLCLRSPRRVDGRRNGYSRHQATAPITAQMAAPRSKPTVTPLAGASGSLFSTSPYTAGASLSARPSTDGGATDVGSRSNAMRCGLSVSTRSGLRRSSAICVSMKSCSYIRVYFLLRVGLSQNREVGPLMGCYISIIFACAATRGQKMRKGSEWSPSSAQTLPIRATAPRRVVGQSSADSLASLAAAGPLAQPHGWPRRQSQRRPAGDSPGARSRVLIIGNTRETRAQFDRDGAVSGSDKA